MPAKRKAHRIPAEPGHPLPHEYIKQKKWERVVAPFTQMSFRANDLAESSILSTGSTLTTIVNSNTMDAPVEVGNSTWQRKLRSMFLHSFVHTALYINSC